MEGEALLIGTWKNVTELEECLNLPELQKLISEKREEEYRRNKFAAALKGIDLDEGANNAAKERFEAVKRRAEAKLRGDVPGGEEGIDIQDTYGFDFEVEE